MKSLFALVAVVFTACALAHSGNPRVRRIRSNQFSLTSHGISEVMTPRGYDPINRESVNYRDVPTYLMERGHIPYLALKAPEFSLLNEAIYDIGRRSEKSKFLYKPESDVGMPNDEPRNYHVPRMSNKQSAAWPLPKVDETKLDTNKLRPPKVHGHQSSVTPKGQEQVHTKEEREKERKKFAFTPMDEEYFEPTVTTFSYKSTSEDPLKKIKGESKKTNGEEKKINVDEKKRNEDSSRLNYKNPILNRAKTLVSDSVHVTEQEVSKPRMHRYIPVSLLPMNLNSPKLNSQKFGQTINGNDSGNLGSTDKTKNSDLLGFISGDTLYILAISAGITASIVLSISLITYGCYILMERAKSAAAVDYPAYGVTGPTVDISGDRRLAQSAQMYHYQHQKQQIIAMERNTIEQRDGSLSAPESEEENEEGDYTVYECPGFATTGDMEVQNPLYEEGTPATLGKVQVLKAQPKE